MHRFVARVLRASAIDPRVLRSLAGAFFAAFIGGCGIPFLTPCQGAFYVNGADPDLSQLADCAEWTGSVQIIETDLVDLEDLAGLRSVSNGFFLLGNRSLESLDGLQALTSAGQMQIQDSDALTNLDGLGALVTIGGRLSVSGNPVLVSIEGLSAVESVGESPQNIEDDGSVTFQDNVMLPQCEIDAFAESIGKECANCEGNEATSDCT